MTFNEGAHSDRTAIVIGGGPAGLMAAEILGEAGVRVTLHERMPTVGRKLLMAGRGGLNLTHSEDFEAFLARYGDRSDDLRDAVEAFPPAALRDWAMSLGQETFIGSSGRVFPQSMKSSPLLRAWLARLSALGVTIVTRSLWRGWDAQGALLFEAADGSTWTGGADITILALGGASWPRLGADGTWVPWLEARGVHIAPILAANCGFLVGWSQIFQERFAGTPVKNIALCHGDRRVMGEMMITGEGLEGGAIYALSAGLREDIARLGSATLLIDLRPDVGIGELCHRLDQPRRGQSLANHLRKAAGLTPVAINLLREACDNHLPELPGELARLIKSLPLRLTATSGIARAISTAGGIGFSELDENLMLKRVPGVFVAGEMLDWEAPTGGYLLQAVLATGARAARGALAYISR
jgi:uncharacterized flavoprotein (TIGR03862 family)